MAPEVLEQNTSADARADQYSLAVIAYELLTGRFPLGVAGSLYDKRPDLPMPFTEAIDRALDHLPENRFPSLVEFANALDRGIRPEGWFSKIRRGWRSASNGIKAGILTLICGGLTILSSSFVRQDLLHRTEQIRTWNERAVSSKSAMNQVREQIRSLKMEMEILHRKMEVEGAVQAGNNTGSTTWMQASNQWHFVQAAYQWMEPRLNAEGHWDAISDLLQAARAALDSESFQEAGPLFERLDQEINRTTNMVATIREAHRLRDAIVRLNTSSPTITKSAGNTAPTDEPSLNFLASGSRQEGIQSLREQESKLRTHQETIFREHWSLFEAAEQHWINLFPESIGPPELKFLADVPGMKDQAQALFQAEQYRESLNHLIQATRIYERWTNEVSTQRMKAHDAWDKAQHKVKALDMRYIKVNNLYWSIWEIRIMDFARWLSDNPEIANLILSQLNFQPDRMGPTFPVTGLDRRTASGMANWFGYQMFELARPLTSLPQEKDWMELWQSENLEGTYQFGITPVEDPARLLVYRDYYLDQTIDPINFLKSTGQGLASPSGLFDLQGNAWEWSASDLLLDRDESNNFEPVKWKLHGGGYFGQHRFNEFEPPRENAVFITRPEAIGFRIVIQPNTTILNREATK
jgi:serine/threonine protein kinase